MLDRARAIAFLAAVTAVPGGCTTATTEVLVSLDTDVPAARAMSIAVRVHRVRGGNDAGSSRVWTRGVDAGGITLPASFAIVPAPGERADDTVRLVVTGSLGAYAGQPAVVIERTALFGFVPHQTVSLRIFLASSCAVATTGCTTMGVPCTLSQLCIDRGMTCGESGTCVSTVTELHDAGIDASVIDTASDIVGIDIVGTDTVRRDACVPDCAGRQCGADPRCGTSCGSCSGGTSCNGSGQCVAAAPRCGDGSCNGSETCTSCAQDCRCASGQSCVAGACCSPSCAGPCVPDGCGGTCGGCPAGRSCSGGACAVVCGDHMCAPFVEGCASCPGDCPCAAGSMCRAGVCCAPSCPASCGSDGCGNYCGACPTGQSCTRTGCRAVCGDGMCAPFVEGCGNCPGDCPCPPGTACSAGVCV